MNTCIHADIDAIRVGDVSSCIVPTGAEAIAAFAAFSCDVNPIHVDAGEARRYGYPNAVAHGMLTLSAISRLIGTQLPGGGSLWVSQEVRFASAVFEGDPIVASVRVEQVSPATGLVVLQTEAVNTATGVTVLNGKARVRVPRALEQGS
jgi:acyl dehydratase